MLAIAPVAWQQPVRIRYQEGDLPEAVGLDSVCELCIRYLAAFALTWIVKFGSHSHANGTTRREEFVKLNEYPLAIF